MKALLQNWLRLSCVVVALSVAALALVSQINVAAQPNNQQDKTKTGQPAPPKDPQKPGQKKDDDPATIKLDTKLVNILFAVQDKQNRYLNDIKAEDITVLEDGKPQQVFTFKKEFDLPLTLAILVDVSGSEQHTIPLLKDAGGRFVDAVMRKNKDTGAVIKFEGEATVMQELTSNPARIRKGLEEIAYTAPPPSGVFGGGTPGINPGSRQGGTSMYDAIYAACADMLAKEPGRKTIILVTDGVDTSSRMKMNDAIESALRAEVVIYAIGIADPGFGGVNEGGLKRLCEATGGRAVIPRSHRELDQAFTQLEQDLRQQFLLAYEPVNEAADGGFRKIEIKLNTTPERPNIKDLRIRHRKGYYAPKG